MGSFLEKPETTKHSLSGEGNTIKWGLSEMQGWRTDMEVGTALGGIASPRRCPARLTGGTPRQDAHFAKTSLEGHPEYSFFGVFDGHGGKTASKIWWVPRETRPQPSLRPAPPPPPPAALTTAAFFGGPQFGEADRSPEGAVGVQVLQCAWRVGPGLALTGAARQRLPPRR